jgi:hypothetical protein
MDDLELYQLFKALHIHTWNTDGVKIEDPNKLGDKELNCEYN